MVALSMRAIVLVLTTTLLTACSRKTSSDDPVFLPPPDPLPFVLSTNPFPQANGVAPAQIISARFSELMAPASLTPASFAVASAGGPVAGSVTLSPDGVDALFTPAAPLDFGTPYTATLTTAVRSASGQPLASTHAWNFTTGVVTNWAWSVPELLENDPGLVPTNNAGPDVAFDDSENACVVWSQYNGTAYEVVATRSSAGGAWQAAAPIGGSAGGIFPVVAIDAQGEALVMWATGTQVWSSRATMMGAWSTPELANETPSWPAYLLDLFVDPAGNAFLFYHEHRSGAVTNNMYVVRYDPANGWLPREDLPTVNSSISFAMDATGTLVTLWKMLNNGLAPDDHRVLSRRFTAATGWSAVETLDPHIPGRTVRDQFVTMDGYGNVLAVWMRRVAGGGSNENEVFMSRRGISSSWTAPELIPMALGQIPDLPAAALGPEGSIALTWVNMADWRCWAMNRDSGGNWDTPQAIDLDSPNQAVSVGFPIYAGLGRIAVIGQETISDDYSLLWVNEFDPSTGWGTPSQFRVAPGYISGYQLTTGSQGRAAATWKESDAPGFTGVNDVWCARFR